jgi:hypothetical protein
VADLDGETLCVRDGSGWWESCRKKKVTAKPFVLSYRIGDFHAPLSPLREHPQQQGSPLTELRAFSPRAPESGPVIGYLKAISNLCHEPSGDSELTIRPLPAPETTNNAICSFAGI